MSAVPAIRTATGTGVNAFCKSMAVLPALYVARFVFIRQSSKTLAWKYGQDAASKTRRGEVYGLRAAGGDPAVAGHGAQVRRSRADPDRDAQHGRAGPQARVQEIPGSEGPRART